jgi:hypothetical protein
MPGSPLRGTVQRRHTSAPVSALKAATKPRIPASAPATPATTVSWTNDEVAGRPAGLAAYATAGFGRFEKLVPEKWPGVTDQGIPLPGRKVGDTA